MNDEKSIAVETSGRRGSVALGEGPRLLAEREFPTQVEHAKELLPAVDELLRRQGWSPADIRHCYVSIGPGSFTGLRVAVAFARHLALATAARVCAVPTLDAVVESCTSMDPPPLHVAVVLDAKRQQVFGAVYEFHGGEYRRLTGPNLDVPAAILAAAPKPISVIGEGVDYHRQAIEASGAVILDQSLWLPTAANVYKLGRRLAERGRFIAAMDLAPCYVRRPEAEELWEKRHAK
jgi:tRNA threonylcarbamoyladenosine biosynthesis protein TsaB